MGEVGSEKHGKRLGSTHEPATECCWHVVFFAGSNRDMLDNIVSVWAFTTGRERPPQFPFSNVGGLLSFLRSRVSDNDSSGLLGVTIVHV